MNNYESELLKQRCLNYLAEEPDKALRLELKALKPGPELDDRMMHNLRFGTAGLRAQMQAGYNRMNLVTVYKLAYALGHEIASSSRVVVAFDGRQNSELFAREVAQVLGMLNFEFYMFSESIPTPLCAFATKYLAATIGVMITASHNPAHDNGIKLFNTKGAQAHGLILDKIEQAMIKAPLRPDFYSHSKKQSTSVIIGEKIFQAYNKAIKTTQLFRPEELDKSVAILYTALHGVGQKFFMRAAKEEGFENISFVKEQALPDGAFPTLCFPNPEEEHTLDMAHAEAMSQKVGWVFANDPDADRLQVSSLNPQGVLTKLSGNEMGSVLGFFAIKKALERGEKPLVASSIVSSRMLKAIAEKLGAYYVDSLTGFSNIADAALKVQENTDYKLVFAYEEALGFLVGSVVLDKDGINAGARFLEIAAWLKQEKMSSWDLLDHLAIQFGLFTSAQWSMRFEGAQPANLMSDFMLRVGALDLKFLANELKIKNINKFDLLSSQSRASYVGIHANVVIFEDKNYFRLIIRPSGTEPKIKFYIETVDKIDNPRTLGTKKAECAEYLRNRVVLLTNPQLTSKFHDQIFKLTRAIFSPMLVCFWCDERRKKSVTF